MAVSLRVTAVWCVAALVVGAGCGEADDLSGPPQAAAGTGGPAATGGTGAGTGGGGAGGTSASGGASGGSGSGGGAGTSVEDASADSGGVAGTAGSAGTAGGHAMDAAADTDNFDGSSDTGADQGSTDANFCLPCPKSAPTSGSACSPCPTPRICTYNACKESGSTIVTATCDESLRSWVLKSDPCNAFQCGPPSTGSRCNSNQICVLPSNTCVDNPCGDQPFSCSCAQAACPGAGYRCIEQSDPRTIHCSCMTC